MSNFDINKNLEELEDEIWEDIPTEEKSDLIGRALQLRRRPLNKFCNDDLRFMIGQEIGLTFLVPLAIEILIENPLAQGAYYEGDLLSSVLEVNQNFWREDPQLWWEVEEIAYESELIVENFLKDVVPKIKHFGQFEPKIIEDE